MRPSLPDLVSVNLHIKRIPSGDSEMHIVCGANEARESWIPIFREFDLPLMDQIFSAGIALDQQNLDQFNRELTVVLSAIEDRHDYQSDTVNIVFRARRLVTLLAEHPIPDYEVYIG